MGKVEVELLSSKIHKLRQNHQNFGPHLNEVEK